MWKAHLTFAAALLLIGAWIWTCAPVSHFGEVQVEMTFPPGCHIDRFRLYVEGDGFALFDARDRDVVTLACPGYRRNIELRLPKSRNRVEVKPGGAVVSR